MKLSKEEFKKLQDYWYKRLEESGFKDIEKKRDNITGLEKNKIEDRDDYYRLVFQSISDDKTTFRDEIDRYILTRHANGAKIKTIVEELSEQGNKRHRKTIRFIIRKYLMAWEIKKFTRKELNLKPRKRDL